MLVSRRHLRVLTLPLLFWAAVGCRADTNTDTDVTETDTDTGTTDPASTNVLVVILDDVGSVSAGAYADYWGGRSTGERDWTPARTAPMPTIEGICDAGVRFTEAWSEPTCSPTRASVLTGRMPFRTGVGEPCGRGANEILPDELTLPLVIGASDPEYGLASVGKWHLGTGEDLGSDWAPNTMGWQHFAGIMGGHTDYFEWQRVEDGSRSTVTDYTTTRITDDALAWLATLDADQPWLLWVAYNAAHIPLHEPPSSLHSYGDLPDEFDEERSLDYFEAMVEALDTELARLLAALPDSDGDGLPDDTLVIVLGDNGTANDSEAKNLPPPYDGARAKGTVYEHGVRIPLCVAGEGVASPGRDEDAFVHVVDLYPTILEAVRVPDEATETVDMDGITLTPYLQGTAHPNERQWLMSEQFSVLDSKSLLHSIAIKDHSYKYVRVLRDPESGEYTNECYGARNLTDAGSADLWGSVVPATEACGSLRDVALGLVCSVEESPHAAWCP